MGGYGSSRWGMALTRPTTQGLPRLDVRTLARAGALRPGTCASVHWAAGTSVTTSVAADAPDCLVVAFAVRAGTGEWIPVVERIQLSRTPCTFGGDRAWVLCPGCASRCAVLYAVRGGFRCRQCHHLKYPSTRATR